MSQYGSRLAVVLALSSLIACSAQPPLEKPPLPVGATRTAHSNDRGTDQCNWLVDRLREPDLSDQDTLQALAGLSSLSHSTDRTAGLEKCLRHRAHAQLLASLTESAETEGLRAAAARALGPLATTADTSDLLTAARQGRYQSLLVFEVLHDPEALDTLISTARRRHHESALVAVRALGNYQEESSRDSLVELAKGTGEPPVLVTSLASLARIGSPDDFWRVKNVDRRLKHIVPPWYRRQPPPRLIKTMPVGSGVKTLADLTYEERVDRSLSRFQDQAALRLRQLRSVAGPRPIVFNDGFESGDANAWSAQHPGDAS